MTWSRRSWLAGWLVVVIALVPVSLVRGQEDRGADDRPIPQDPARLKQKRAARLAHYRRMLVEPYDEVGKKDARWDEQARRALDQAARYYAKADEDWMTPQAIHGLFQEAVDAGCDDPLVRYIQARMVAQLSNADPDTVLRAHYESADALTASRYPPMQIGLATALAAGFLSTSEPHGPARAKRANDWLRTSLDELVHSAKTDRRTPEMESEWYRWAKLVTEAYRDGGDSFEEAEEKVEQALAKTPVLEGTLHSLRGDAAIAAAWRARGSGVSSTVTEEGARIFEEKLTEARREFEAAAAAQPGDSIPPIRLITVDMGLDGDREVMEKWFTRAMEADGDNREACIAKLYWLEPKWRGTPEDLIAFGRACAATKNWRAGITLLAAHAHQYLARTMEVEEYSRYFDSDEVYDEISAVYQDYLEHFPADRVERTNFAVFLVLCRYSRPAAQQFEQAGDIGAATSLFSKAFVDYMRQQAIERARQLDDEPSPETPD